ncbi:MAG: cupin domain-containing protein [Thermomicrobiales bacterium]|nr:cupin domain-containing protein [Thermomicrobiales bacterium]
MGIQRMTIDEAQASPAANPIFVGEVVSQHLVPEGVADLLRVTAVTFRNGARNRRHTHSTDQVLVATSGEGFVACDNKTLTLRSGDVAFIERNTPHWHGANPNQDFTHLSILTPGHMEIQDDSSTAEPGEPAS